ncbi:MAG TPA: rod shape-determining protein MreC [Allosphingosinicella sp.]
MFIGYVVAVAGSLFAVLLIAIAIVDPRGFAALKGAALDVTTPVSSGGRSVTGLFSGAVDGISNYFRAGSQNAGLRRELDEARRELVRRQALEYENRRLLAMLGLARRVDDEVTIARIVGSSFDSPRRMATLSAGTSSGVATGQPVRSPDGLIGRVMEVGRWASRVLLITDGGSDVPVRLVRDGTPALAVGRGDGTIELRTLEVGQNPFRRGDILVTSGVGGVYPPNVPVAVVSAIRGDTAIALPTADPARVDFAIVERSYQPAAADPDAPLSAAPQVAPAPPIAGPPPGTASATHPGQQSNPRYQPGLQQPQPGNVPRTAPPAPAPAPAAAPPVRSGVPPR